MKMISRMPLPEKLDLIRLHFRKILLLLLIPSNFSKRKTILEQEFAEFPAFN
jgi:hypothetical protein